MKFLIGPANILEDLNLVLIEYQAERMSAQSENSGSELSSVFLSLTIMRTRAEMSLNKYSVITIMVKDKDRNKIDVQICGIQCTNLRRHDPSVPSREVIDALLERDFMYGHVVVLLSVRFL